MTVSPWVHHVLLYGALALVAGALYAFYVRDAPKVLPDAIVRPGPARAIRRAVVRGGPWVGLVGGAVAAIWLYTQATSFILVTDRGAEWGVHLGAKPDFARIDARHDDPRTDRVWVVNRSKHVVRVVTIEYGSALAGGDADAIPPGDAEAFDDIDYVGPDDKPPDQVTVTKGSPGTSRRWLTWD